MAILGVNLDDTTNVDPNTLTTPNPLTVFEPNRKPMPVNPDWIDQGIKAFFIRQGFEAQHWDNIGAVGVDFIPSNPAATYTITLWKLSVFGDWTQCENLGTNTYTGRKNDFIETLGLFGCILYLSIDSIDSGTLSIAVDEGGFLVEAV